MTRHLTRALAYAAQMRRSWHPRYAIAFGTSRLFPEFAAGAIIARIYRLAGFRIGARSAFMGPLRVVSGARFEENLIIGDDVVIATDVTINVDALVTIADGASIGPFVRIYTGTHRIGPGSRRMMPNSVGRPVSIGRGAWVGLGATILPGVTIGNGAVVAAGSVVVSDVAPNAYAEGNPAVAVRTLPWGDR